MKFIDARTGQNVEPHVPVLLNGGVFDADGNLLEARDDSYVLLSTGSPGLFSIPIRIMILDSKRTHDFVLPIRYLHPDFLFQRVAFIPT